MKKIFFDTEFTGLHRNTTLISIGLVSESGSIFYAEFTDYRRDQVDQWIEKNVIDNLSLDIPTDSKYYIREYYNTPTDSKDSVSSIKVSGTTNQIKIELLAWLDANVGFIRDDKLQFVSDCYAYDWMLLVDLLTDGGSALDMPEFIYYIPLDLSTLLYARGIDPDINREEFAGLNTDVIKHNSLHDALTIKWCYERCMGSVDINTP